MTILYAEEFRKQFAELPKDAQRLFRVQERRFKDNPHDPCLHIKKLHGEPLMFSFRITRRYRVLFVFFESEAVLFATIGHRKEIYQ